MMVQFYCYFKIFYFKINLKIFIIHLKTKKLIQVVQEYERAVIFRLGRLRKGENIVKISETKIGCFRNELILLIES